MKNYANLPNLHNSSAHAQYHPVIANYVDLPGLHILQTIQQTA